MSEEIQGWKPPVIYDVSEGKTRIATQADIDRLVLVESAYRKVAMVVHETFKGLTNGNVHVFNGRALYDGPAKADP